MTDGTITGASTGRSRTVIIIGAGLAGIVAAIHAQQEGADVLLLDRGPVGTGTNSCLANAYFAGPVIGYTAQAYIRDTLDAGRSINHHPTVDFVAQEAPSAFQLLRSLGLPVTQAPTGLNVDSPVPGVIPGVALMRRLAETLGKLGVIRTRKGFFVREIVVQENRALGVRGIGQAGEDIFLPAQAVILATGGAGAIYLRNDNQKKILGQGYYLAAKAGLSLWDMEFVQFYPLVLSEPGYPSLILFPPYPRETRLIDEAGEDVLARSGLGGINTAIMKKRDEFSAFLYHEVQTSRVYMDFRHLPDALWDVHPFTILKKLKFDFRARPVAVSPAAHFFMGGVKTDDQGQTDVPGLFACGEILWGLHGANRMGGNALTECVVTGSRAGRFAARYGQASHPVPVFLPEDSSPFYAAPSAPPATGVLKGLLQRIKPIASGQAGVVRTGRGIQEGLRQVSEIKRSLRDVSCPDREGRILREDCLSACFTLEAVLTASLGREESRGSFVRSDFPEEDNQHWQKNSQLQYDAQEDRFSLRYLPV